MGRRDAVAFTLEWAAEARLLGADVTYEPGWEKRGNGYGADYEGGLVHHTASASSLARPNPTLSILVGGRPDLSGPLCNVTGPACTPDRPRLHVVAAFPANHAGASGGRSMGPLPVTNLFNPRVFGLEIDYAGNVAMLPGQYLAAVIFGAAVTRVLRRPSAEWIRAHAETSITGKWDPGFAPGRTIDMAAFRRDVWARAVNVGGLSVADINSLQSGVTELIGELRGNTPERGLRGGWKATLHHLAADKQPYLTVVQALFANHRELNGQLDAFARDTAPKRPARDSLFGHVLSSRAEQRENHAAVLGALQGISAALGELRAAVEAVGRPDGPIPAPEITREHLDYLVTGLDAKLAARMAS